MSRIICLLLCLGMLLGGMPAIAEEEYWIVEDNADWEVNPLDQARGVMRGMTVEEKVYQLFIVSPEDLVGREKCTSWPETNPFVQYPVGGVVLFGQNIVSEKQLQSLAESIFVDAAGACMFMPFLAVDEEGGSVSRVANKLDYPFAPAPARIESAAMAKETGLQIAGYLKPFGINLNFAPVADVMIVDAPEIGDRSFGWDVQDVTEYSLAMAEGFREKGVIPCFKHFPGHGAVAGNTHQGKASTKRTPDQMRQAELIPFAAGIENDIEMIMISHFTAQGLDEKNPCSLSARVIQGLLREEMGYQGVIITDALRMEAILKYYDSDESAVLAFQAGADILLLPNNFQKAAEGVLKAVNNGEISMDRLNESVERILALKIQYGLIQ